MFIFIRFLSKVDWREFNLLLNVSCWENVYYKIILIVNINYDVEWKVNLSIFLLLNCKIN